MAYIQRSLRQAILKASQKVVIVEGARAVGKTSMARHELEPAGYSYYTLADNATYEIAKADPDFWVESINHPAIIDEAQRVKGLTLALKEYVDRQEELGVYFILTGSASIGKAGLDGQDPLTRRCQRFTLNPFTQREIIGNKANLVDDLWEGNFNTRFKSNLSNAQLKTQLTMGGFPHYVEEGVAGRISGISNQVLLDIKSVLGDTLLPDERLDQAIANTILKRLLTSPGDILNVSNIGRSIDYDNRTVERYISIFDRRFLIRYLPNLKLMPQKQNFTRAKIHPVDTSFSIAAINEAGFDPIENRSFLGKLLESYVVAQVMPDAQWAEHKASCYYWREAGRDPKEVDLVLCCNNELIGVEVKASTSFSSDDFAGLRALAEDLQLRFGYLVYMGQKIVRVSEKLWAIPLDALWSPAARSDKDSDNLIAKRVYQKEGMAQLEDSVIADANLILSYCHADNEHLDNAMVLFVEELTKEYEFQFGRQIRTFIDKSSLRWGDNWQVEIDKSLEETNYLIPCVTPRYLQSAACREEFIQFLGRVKQNDRCRILSLLWQKPNIHQPDQVYDAICTYQFEDVTALRDLTPKDKEYKKVIRSLVETLHEVIVANDLSASEIDKQSGAYMELSNDGCEVENDGMLEKMDNLALNMPRFEEALENIKEEVVSINEAFNTMPPLTNITGSYKKWGIALAGKTTPALDRMMVNLDKANEVWTAYYDLMTDYVRIGRETKQNVGSVLPMLYNLRNSTAEALNVDEVKTTMEMLPMLSSRLKPLAQGLKRLLDFARDVTEMTDSLIVDVEELQDK